MNKSMITKGVITFLVLVGGWASPSILVSSQETETPEEINMTETSTVVEEPVRLELTTQDIVLEYGETLQPEELVVAGRYDTLSLPVVNTSELGEHTLTYKATKGLDEVTLTKKFSVVDTVAPEFTKIANTIKVDYEEEFDFDVIAGFFAASDNVDGELDIQLDGTYDDTKSGDYDLVAYAEDNSGNRVEHKFVVNVAEKPKPKPTPTYTSVSSTPASGSRSYGSSNTYAAGWCTWWVAQRRIEIGRPLPNTLGHAMTWIGRAPAYGQTVVYGKPIYGAVVYPSYNHVAFVERVNADGSIVISEMGWNFRAWNKNVRTLSASAASTYGYIY